MSQDEARELLEGILNQSLVNYSRSEIVDFLDNWLDENLDEDIINEFDPLTRERHSPEEVINSLEDSTDDMDIMEVVELAEEIAEDGWGDKAPDFSGTREVRTPTLAEKASFPGQKDFYLLEGNYEFEIKFSTGDKHAHLVRYDGKSQWYSVTVPSITEEEMKNLFKYAERSVHHLEGEVEVEYKVEADDEEDEDYDRERALVEPKAVREFFRYMDEREDEEIYSLAAASENSNIVFERKKDESAPVYTMEVKAGGRDENQLNVLNPLVPEKTLKGMKTAVKWNKLE